MDRTIKFRVWNGERMLYPEYFGSDAYGSQGQITIGWTNQSYIDIGSIRQQPYEAWEGCTLMQFTGLYDSEGNEIYEKDVVECTALSTTHIVAVRDIRNIPIEITVWKSAYNDFKSKVIGNLYEHPNLLNNESIIKRNKPL